MSTDIALRNSEQVPAIAERPAHDLRHAMINLPVEDQNRVLSEYVERRNNFRHWLKSQFEEGLHFGTPPGCGPRGNPRPEQWQHKPSLYAAGADMICDLMGLRAEFHADLEAWKQLGAKDGTFVIVCRLYSRSSGELIGEGRGVRRDGQKGGDANNALKMAQKSAKVDAVLNCYGLRDLYGQDLDVPNQPAYDNPEQSGNQSQQQPRGKRAQESAVISPAELNHLKAHWIVGHKDPDGDKAKMSAGFKMWVMEVTERTFNPLKLSEWRTREEWERCCHSLGIGTEVA